MLRALTSATGPFANAFSINVLQDVKEELWLFTLLTTWQTTACLSQLFRKIYFISFCCHILGPTCYLCLRYHGKYVSFFQNVTRTVGR